jgi:hypothetical protein
MAGLRELYNGAPVFEPAPVNDTRLLRTPLQQPITTTDGAFAQGVKRGVRGLKSGAQNFAGTVAEVVGADETANSFYEDARRESEQSQRDSIDIPRLADVKNFSDGARFVAGSIGQGLPYLAPAVGATTAARLLGAGNAGSFAAGAAANAIPEIGGVQERLRNDEVTAAMSPEKRAAIAFGEGAVRAGVNQIVPQAIVGRALGARGYANPLTTSPIRQTVKDVGKDIAAEGASEAATEYIGQNVQSALNPNRDRTNDRADLLEAGVAGGLGATGISLPASALGNTLGAARGATENLVRDPRTAEAINNALNTARSRARQVYDDPRTQAAMDKASDLKDQTRDWFAERTKRATDAVSKTLRDIQTPPAGLDEEQLDSWLTEDDTKRNAAAEIKARQYLDDEFTPENLKAAAKDFLKSSMSDNAWETITNAEKNAERVAYIKSGLTSLGNRVKRGIDVAKDRLKTRENAQNVNSLVDDGFDSILADTLFKNTGLTTSADILNELPAAASGMKDWMTSIFTGDSAQAAKLTEGLMEAFTDPAAATQDTYDLMVKQGLIKPNPTLISGLVGQIKKRAAANKSDADTAEAFILPTAKAAMSVTKDDYADISSSIKSMIVSGKFDEANLTAMFGANKDILIETLTKSMERVRTENQRDDADDKLGADGRAQEDEASADFEEMANITTDPTKPNEFKGDVKFKGPFKRGEAGPETKAKQMSDEMTTAFGQEVNEMGYIDMLREQFGERPEAFLAAVTSAIKKYKDLLVTDADKANPDVALNKKLFVLRAEDIVDTADSLDIDGATLFSITPNSESNVWAESVGKNNEFADVSRGKVFFERVTLDKETGEITTKVFATSTNKLIKHARAAKAAGSLTTSKTGVLEQIEMLNAGISSMMTAKNADGRAATSGRVGFVLKPGGEVKWSNKLSTLPEGLKLPSGSLVGKQGAVQSEAINVADNTALNKWLEGKQDAEWKPSYEKMLAEAIDDGNQKLVDSLNSYKAFVAEVKLAKAAMKSKDAARIRRVLSELTDDWGDVAETKPIALVNESKLVAAKSTENNKRSTDETEESRGVASRTRTTTRTLGEVEEMTDAANKAENSKVREFDENGDPVQPRERLVDPDSVRTGNKKLGEQVEFLNTLLDKGFPAFSAKMKTLSPERLAKVRETLENMLGGTMTDALRARAMNALDLIGGKSSNVRMGDTISDIRENAQTSFTEAPTVLTPEQRDKIRADVIKRLGPDVAVEFVDKLFSSKEGSREISGEWQEGLMRISLAVMDASQIAAHESYHEFFTRLNQSDIGGAKRVQDILTNAANSPAVMKQLERLLDKHPEALKQIRGGAGMMEERQAYMYQFWQAGLLKVGPSTNSTFKKILDFFRRVTGLLSNDQKTEAILQAFDMGKAQTADMAAKVLADSIEYRSKQVNAAFAVFKPVTARIGRAILSNESILTGSDNPALSKLLRQFKNVTGEATEQSYIEAKGQMMSQYQNKFELLTRGLEDADLTLAQEYLNREDGTLPNAAGPRSLVIGIRKLLDEMDTYMRDANVKTLKLLTTKDGTPILDKNGKERYTYQDFGRRENYYPQSYEISLITADPQGFKADLYKYHKKQVDATVAAANEEIVSGKTKKGATLPDTYASAIARGSNETEVTAEDILDAITNRIIESYGNPEIQESTSEIGFSPKARAINRRTLDWLDRTAMNKWMNKDMVNVVQGYIAQAVKRAEYVRRFDNNGSRIQETVEEAFKYEQAKAIAKIKDYDAASVYSDLEGAMTELTADEKTEVEAQALKAMQGPLKNIMALEGTIGFDINPTNRRIQGTLIAYGNLRTMGASVFSTFIDPLGILIRGGEMKGAFDAYTRGLREVKASWTGKRIEDNATAIAEMLGTVDSANFLANFGQAQSSMYLHKSVRKWNEGLFKWNGMEGMNRGMRVAATQAAIAFIKRQVEAPTADSKRYLDELLLSAEDVQITDGELNYADPKIQVAVRRWVDGAILRPNAAQRTAWMSDPHYAIFAHMKQFAYTFHDVILKRAWIEAKEHKNFGPMGVLVAGFTPMMIAADAAKSILLTGSEPVWMKQGLEGQLSHGARRAGLLGFATPYVDPLIVGHPASMLGPTVEQGVSVFTQPFGESVQDALPGASIINTMDGPK